MPADISATCYRWYMADTRDDTRIVMYEWVPAGEFSSSMAMGTLHLKTRDTPEDAWVERMRIGGEGEMIWVVAQKFARNEGFSIEEAVH